MNSVLGKEVLLSLTGCIEYAGNISFSFFLPKAWSITYHSWLTFVLLIWSCTLWMIRNRRKYAMISSPFMVVYGNLLLMLQYIWSINLHNHELPEIVDFLVRKAPGELASKVGVIGLQNICDLLKDWAKCNSHQ